jgi:uncharacterized phage-associated protein
VEAVSAHDVCDELQRRLPSLGAVKKHKLLYYAQGWHLAVMGRPLFVEPIEAWADGPVVGALWADEKHDRGRPARRPLSDEQSATVDYVVHRYGSYASRELIHLTHSEDPWRDASLSESDTDLAVPSPVIQHDALRAWFASDVRFRAMKEKAARLRSRRDVYSFTPAADVPGIDAAIERALAGQRVRHGRDPEG